MDLHQQVGKKSGYLSQKPENDRKHIAQEVEMWVRESEGREKFSNVAKLQPLNYTEFEVATSPKLTAEWHQGGGDGEGI